MKQHIRKIIAILAAVMLLVYVAWQVTANLTEQIKTVDAMEVTVEEKISVRGWFIRQQTLVESESGDNAEYLVSDGEKIAKGARLAVFFSDEESRRAYHQAQTLGDRLDALEYAYGMIQSGVDSVKMDQLIADDIMELCSAFSGGETKDISTQYAAMQQLIASRGSTGEDQESFDARITQLKQEISACEKQYAAGSSYVKSGLSGYFVSGSDGYETLLSADALDTLTPEMLENLQRDSDREAVGSIVTGYHWYYAAVLDKEQASQLQTKNTVELYFPELSQTLVTMQVYRLQTYESGKALLILESSEMLPQYLTSREQDADLLLAVHTGLKVPTQALRQQDGAWGVYVLESNTMSFKPIEWVYQTDSYYLVPSAKSSKAGLYRYDRIIVQGKNLEDDRLIR